MTSFNLKETDMNESAWTAADERDFRALSSRRERYEAARHEKLARAAAGLDLGVAIPVLVATLKEHAVELVAALEPYANDRLPTVTDRVL
jgi:hypothetical protein